MRTLFFALVLTIANGVLAQSPGGVSAGLTAWYKANVTATVIGQPGPVSAWNTSGGSATGYNLTQSTPANKPGYILGSTNYKQYNYNPRINFIKASSTWLGNSNGTPELYGGSTGSLFLVSDQMATSNGSGLTYRSTSDARMQIKPSWRMQSSAAASSVGYYTNPVIPAPTENSDLAASSFTIVGIGSSVAYRRNSAPPLSTSNSSLYWPGISMGCYLGANSGTTEFVDHDLGEVIFYNVDLSTADRNRVESYLAIKYGITRGGNTGTSATYDYLASNGTTTIWSKTTNTGYNNDIAGIGRDDGSALVQKQSISVNTTDPVSIGLVSVDASNADNLNNFTSNLSFLVWGNDGGVPSTIYNDPLCFSQLPTGVQARVKRKWKGQVTNYTQLVTVGFETSIITDYLPLTNLRLLVDNDGVNWTDATVYSGAALDGGRIEFAGVTINSTKPYFTLATINFTNTTLPVELLTFDAVPEGNEVRLSWSTASEQYNDHFAVERSADAATYKIIGTVPGAGNSAVRINYGILDDSPLPGTSYYRLRQVDLNGVSELSEVRPVTLPEGRGPVLFPNPVSERLNIADYDPSRDGPVFFHNALGERVAVPDSSPSQGEFQMSGLPPGLYIAVVAGRVAHFVKE